MGQERVQEMGEAERVAEALEETKKLVEKAREEAERREELERLIEEKVKKAIQEMQEEELERMKQILNLIERSMERVEEIKKALEEGTFETAARAMMEGMREWESRLKVEKRTERLREENERLRKRVRELEAEIRRLRREKWLVKFPPEELHLTFPVVMGSDGRVTIPDAVRILLNLRQGDILIIRTIGHARRIGEEVESHELRQRIPPEVIDEAIRDWIERQRAKREA